jgi:hypothetical protein
MEWIDVIVRIIFLVLGTVVTLYVVPWLEEKKLYGIVKKAVYAAEKWAENNDIDKHAYVVDKLTAAGIKITPVVDAFIEAAVKELDIALGNMKSE